MSRRFPQPSHLSIRPVVPFSRSYRISAFLIFSRQFQHSRLVFLAIPHPSLSRVLARMTFAPPRSFAAVSSSSWVISRSLSNILLNFVKVTLT